MTSVCPPFSERNPASYGWMSGVSPLDAFMSVKMGTFREFQLYMVW